MIEQTILAGMIHNESYVRAVLPFLKDEYFEDQNDKFLYGAIKTYIDQYNGLPTKTALRIAIDESNNLNEERYKQVTATLDSLAYDEKTDQTWLVNTTEKFCQDKAIYNAVRQSILVLDGKAKELDKGAIPQLLSDALGVSFDTNVGHDFLENSDERFEFYHRLEEKLEFDLEYFNKITKGGLSKKSLSVALAGTGVGKTLFMTHCAASSLMAGKNVLYITMEMAEERIAERIDANLLDVTLDDLRLVPLDSYRKKIDRVKARTSGKLIVKEYPTGSAGANHFRHLLNELKLKKKFVPDIIFIDYLNICMSSRLKHGANINSYTLIKAIAEELRGLAMEFNVPVMTATQTTRSGYCLSPNSIVMTDAGELLLKDVRVGDKVLSNNGWNEVLTVFTKVKKKMFRITTESGESIIASEDHLFPTENGEKNIRGGLCLEDRLHIDKDISLGDTNGLHLQNNKQSDQ